MKGLNKVGWVERQRNPSTNLEGCMMGFVSLNPSYELLRATSYELRAGSEA